MGTRRRRQSSIKASAAPVAPAAASRGSLELYVLEVVAAARSVAWHSRSGYSDRFSMAVTELRRCVGVLDQAVYQLDHAPVVALEASAGQGGSIAEAAARIRACRSHPFLVERT